MPLIQRTGKEYSARPAADVARTLGLAYPDLNERDALRCVASLESIAESLTRGDHALAAIRAVQLRLPTIDPTGMAKLTATRELHKANFDPSQPRVPAGNSDAGQWTNEDGAGGVPRLYAENTLVQSDATSTGAAEEPVRLPPGNRNDELGDLLEWIANAKPEDRAAITAEIQRLYLRVGDSFGGGEMLSALSDAMDATSRSDREAILRDYEFYTHGDPAEIVASRNALVDAILLGPLAARGAAEALTPVATEMAASEVWKLGWAARGRAIEEALGANLPRNFPVIDSFADGVATSIKSVDLNSAIYQDAGRLTARLNTYVDQLATFAGKKWANENISAEAITNRILNVAVPRGGQSAVQQVAIETARARAQSLGVDLKITPF